MSQAKPASKAKRAKTVKTVAAAVAKKRSRVPYAELRARKEVAERALDDIRLLMADADPLGEPEEFAAREKKAMVLLEELTTLLPKEEPLEPEERARLEKELEDKPDNETLRKILLEMERFLDDPSFPEEMRAEVDRTPIARATEALANELRTPKLRDPRDAALRIEAAKLAAKLRS